MIQNRPALLQKWWVQIQSVPLNIKTINSLNLQKMPNFSSYRASIMRIKIDCIISAPYCASKATHSFPKLGIHTSRIHAKPLSQPMSPCYQWAISEDIWCNTDEESHVCTDHDEGYTTENYIKFHGFDLWHKELILYLASSQTQCQSVHKSRDHRGITAKLFSQEKCACTYFCFFSPLHFLENLLHQCLLEWMMFFDIFIHIKQELPWRKQIRPRPSGFELN